MFFCVAGVRSGREGRGRGPPHERQRHLLRSGHQDRHPPDPQGTCQPAGRHCPSFPRLLFPNDLDLSLTLLSAGHQVRRLARNNARNNARINARNNARKREENELYENVLDLVLGTLYITSYINHQEPLSEFQGQVARYSLLPPSLCSSLKDSFHVNIGSATTRQWTRKL